VTISLEQRGLISVLNLKGTFVGRPAVSVFERAVFDLLREDQTQIILDLSGLRFIDSAGLGAIISAMVSVGRKEGALKLSSLQGDVRDIVSRMNLNKVFEIHDTIADAETSLGMRRGS